MGKTRLLRDVTSGCAAVWLRGGSLPAPLQAAEIAAALSEQVGGDAGSQGGVASTEPAVRAGSAGDTGSAWDPLFSLLRHPAAIPDGSVLVVDDADRLLLDRRFIEGLRSLWSEMRAHARRVHLLFTAAAPRAGEAMRNPDAWGEGAGPLLLDVPPLGLREAAALVPDWSAEECVTMYGLLGGVPAAWAAIDPSVRPSTNLARLLLAPGARLRGLPRSFLPPPGARQERSLAILHGLAHGARSWGEIREHTRIFRSSSELGPYMKGLIEQGSVMARVSLDAGPRSRNRRYSLVHPLVAFWLRSIVPRLGELDSGVAPQQILQTRIQPEIPGLVTAALPGIVAAYLGAHGSDRFPGEARETGSVWGEGFDIEVAGTLTSGAAVYGHLHWNGSDVAADALDRLGDEVKRTRYGFGREARLRFLLLRGEPPHDLARRAARTPAAFLLGPADLVGRN